MSIRSALCQCTPIIVALVAMFVVSTYIYDSTPRLETSPFAFPENQTTVTFELVKQTGDMDIRPNLTMWTEHLQYTWFQIYSAPELPQQLLGYVYFSDSFVHSQIVVANRTMFGFVTLTQTHWNGFETYLNLGRHRSCCFITRQDPEFDIVTQSWNVSSSASLNVTLLKQSHGRYLLSVTRDDLKCRSTLNEYYIAIAARAALSDL